MTKILTFLFTLITLSFVTNAQRNFPGNTIVRTQTNSAFRPLIRIHPRPLQRRKAREERRRQEIIQPDSLNLKQGWINPKISR